MERQTDPLSSLGTAAQPRLGDGEWFYAACCTCTTAYYQQQLRQLLERGGKDGAVGYTHLYSLARGVHLVGMECCGNRHYSRLACGYMVVSAAIYALPHRIEAYAEGYCIHSAHYSVDYLRVYLHQSACNVLPVADPRQLLCIDTWAVQWYEYTGVLGGSLWVLLTNIVLFEAIRAKRWVAPAVVVALPLILSLVLYSANAPKREQYTSRTAVKIASIQPNVDCYTKFLVSQQSLQTNLIKQLQEVTDEVDFILMPETSLATTVNERFIGATRIVQGISTQLKSRKSKAMVIAGTESVMAYGTRRKSDTNRRSANGSYYDIFNSSIGINSNPAELPNHNKCKLVIGVETLPAWFRAGGIFEVDLGGTAGQLGIGKSAEPFSHNGIKIAPAICYEGLYGDFMGEFVRNGAQIFSVVSNDGWWGDTPGYKYLFAYCRLRAIEHRRDVARSANTGISGFINSRGDALQTLDWDKKGVIVEQLRLNDKMTFYTRHGDYLGRLSLYVALLCLLYTVAILSKKKFYLD